MQLSNAKYEVSDYKIIETDRQISRMHNRSELALAIFRLSKDIDLSPLKNFSKRYYIIYAH